MRERDSAPRDTYLALDYNTNDDVRAVPYCAGLTAAACESAVRSAGFYNVRHVTLTGRDVDYTAGPGIARRTDPVAGASVPVSREVVVYANPPAPLYTAWRFHPIVRFDSSEDWRPLNVTNFFAERTPDGSPRHALCNDWLPGENTPECIPLTDASVFSEARFRDPVDYVHVQGYDGGGQNPAAYRTPHACVGDGIRECELGPLAGTYFHVVRSPGGYDVFDYWWFYRFNDVPDEAHAIALQLGTPLRHEGDWEGVSIGVRPGAATFDYASFSQHGTWYRYLRGTLECDAGGFGSCGAADSSLSPARGARVHTFVADGTHANYPHPCKRTFLANCNTNHSDLPLETGYDGERRWEAGSDPGTPLIEFSEADPWLRWAGRWGLTRVQREDWADGPNSPAGPGPNGAHYAEPWRATCASGHAACNSSEPTAASASAGSSSAMRACASWLGGGVVAIACSPRELEHALARARLGHPGEMRLDIERAEGRAPGVRVAAAPGIAQALAAPLGAGDVVSLRGRIAADAVLMTRVAGAPAPVVVRLDGPARGRRALRLRIARAGREPLVALEGPGRVIRSRASGAGTVFAPGSPLRAPDALAPPGR